MVGTHINLVMACGTVTSSVQWQRAFIQQSTHSLPHPHMLPCDMHWTDTRNLGRSPLINRAQLPPDQRGLVPRYRQGCRWARMHTGGETAERMPTCARWLRGSAMLRHGA